jgi:hypothetical protein
MKPTAKSAMVDTKQSDDVAGDRDLVTVYFEKQAESYSALSNPDVHSGAAVLIPFRRRLAVELLSKEDPQVFLDIATGRAAK